jgi:hypothetical protein
MSETPGATAGGIMKSAVKSDVRRLCKAVSEEEDNARLQTLLDELLQLLEERQLMTLLL